MASDHTFHLITSDAIWRLDKKCLQNKHKINSTQTEEYLWTSKGLLQLYIVIYTGMLKAMATTDTFLMIDQVVLLIDD